MNQNIAAAKDDDEIVFKIKRSAIADALRSDFEMPIPVTDANIEVVVNQITALIDEFPTGVPTEFFDLGIDHHKGIDFYRRIYDLLGDINGPCCGTAWASEDSSLVYFAVADETDGLTVFHIPSAALAQIDRRDQGDLHEFAGAIQDLHVDDVYAENSRVLEFARNSPAAASFGSGAEPEFGFYGVVYLYREDGKINFSAAVDSFAFKADTRDLAALRGLSDAELASEIEKADSAAYYAARKWHADLQFESARRLHASTDCGQRESGRDPQAMANAAVKAAKGRDGDAAGHDGIIH